MHAYESHARGTHAREIYIYEMHELGRYREIFDLSPSLPIFRRIGDALNVIFGAKPSVKGVTDP
jgi:hypothetical protein